MISRVIITRNSLNKIINEQQKILSSQKDIGAYTDEIVKILEEIGKIEVSLDTFYSKLNKVVTDIIDKIRASYENEKNNLNEYKSELYVVKREVTEMASLAMYSNINRVRTTFSDIVLKGDLGIIDVAWEKKDLTSDEIYNMRMKRALEIRSLYLELESME